MKTMNPLLHCLIELSKPTCVERMPDPPSIRRLCQLALMRHDYGTGRVAVVELDKGHRRYLVADTLHNAHRETPLHGWRRQSIFDVGSELCVEAW